MLNKLMITTALTGLMIGGALAQTSAPADRPASPPAATQTAPSTAPTPVPAPRASMPATGGSASFINSQKPDQLRASKFKGTNVLGSDDQKIGDVSDILFDKEGKIEAFIISVGGFLGMGAKEVALAPKDLTMVPGEGNNPNDLKVKVSMTKDQLQQAANFERYSPPRTTTGAGGGMGTRPAPATPSTSR